VVDQAQALTTVLSARDKLVEARLTLKGGIADLRTAIQFYRKGKLPIHSQPLHHASPSPIIYKIGNHFFQGLSRK